MVIPEEYIIQKFYQYAGLPTYNKFTNVYTGCCPICREGKSWGKKKRLFFIVKDNALCCHNCGWYGNPIEWIKEVCSCTFADIVRELKECSYYTDIENYIDQKEQKTYNTVPDLPEDSINLFDENQVEYYNSNKHVSKALNIIRERKLDLAVNRPKALWFSLKDYIHSNRIIIPFYNNNRVVHYQSRSIYSHQTPKYLSKQQSDKTVFNIDNITTSNTNIYITEGPIDSFFIKNGVAIAGIQENSSNLLTAKQRVDLNQFILHQKIWVLDSQWVDTASLNKTRILCDLREKVFIWPKGIGTKYKDINELCMSQNIDRIPESFIHDNTYTGIKGKLMLRDA